MKTSKTLIVLSSIVAVVAMIISVVGLFSMEGEGPFTFTTLHGRTVEIYGRGLYRYDWAFRAPIFRGTDAILLFIGIPLLVGATVTYSRGSLRGGFLLTGLLVCFLYNAVSVTFGAAYNDLYLLYVVYFSASLYAFVLAFSAIDLDALPARVSPKLPHVGIAIFLFLSGLSPSVWLIEIVAALQEGGVPEAIASYTTDVTTALDIGLVMPTSFLAGYLLLRRKPLAYPLACVLLTLLSLIGLIVAGQSGMQYLDGIRLTTQEYLAYVTPFVLLSFIAMGLLATLLRNLREPSEI